MDGKLPNTVYTDYKSSYTYLVSTGCPFEVKLKLTYEYQEG